MMKKAKNQNNINYLIILTSYSIFTIFMIIKKLAIGFMIIKNLTIGFMIIKKLNIGKIS
jgi:hypothetical protein